MSRLDHSHLQPPEPDYSKLRILLVEDNPTNQQVALFQLAEFGCQLVVASSGAEALALLKQNDFDLIFMDCQMPVMDGYQTTAEIRRRETDLNLPRVRIVALTAHAMSGDRERCLRAGMDEHLGKPVRPEHFQAILERMRDPDAQDWGSLAPVMEQVPMPVFSSFPLLDPAILARLQRESPAGIFGKLVEIFLDSAPKYMTNIETLMEDGNWAALARQAHALGGSCSHFGAASVVEVCLRLERASIQHDASVIVQLVAELREKLKLLYQEMERLPK